MKVIFALGNPTPEYDGTRHNVGFMALDKLAIKYGARFVSKSKFQAEIAEIGTDAGKALLVKPTTFYNDAGHSARSLADFYKFEPSEDLLVVHDDLALPFGTIRIREKGSDAGNNGIKSLNAHIGQDYGRIRIGIYTELRDRMDDADFVLNRFTESENTALEDAVLPKVIETVQAFLAGTIETTSHALLQPVPTKKRPE